jgi:hypothetical protein
VPAQAVACCNAEAVPAVQAGVAIQAAAVQTVAAQAAARVNLKRSRYPKN